MILSITKADPTGSLPELTVNPHSRTPYGLTGGGALTPTTGVTYTFSDETIGTFEGGSFVSTGKLGKTTVTATFPGNNNLNAGTWTGAVTVELTGGIYLEVGGEKIVYPSLQSAYDALPTAGGTIHVLGNATVDAGLTTDPGKDVTVVGETGEVEPTLTRSGDFSTFTVTGAALTLSNITVTSASGQAENGGTVYVGDGGSLDIGSGVKLIGNNASGKGGAVYVAAGAVGVTVSGTTVQNNEASFGNGIYIEDGATVKIAGSVSGLGDGIAIGYDDTKTGTDNRGTVDVTGELDSKLTVEFEDPAAQLGGGVVYVKSSAGLDAATLKSNLLVRNPGYTFNPNGGTGLSLIQADTIAAARQVGGEWVGYADPQEAIDAAQSGETVYFAVYTNDIDPSLNTTEVALSKTLTVPAGKTLTFAGVNKHVPTSNVPELLIGGVTVKRADGNTDALVKVAADAELTLGNITLDGGAVWPGGISITDDTFGGAGTVQTNNTGIAAHAPVIVNAGTLNIETGATIENNDNNYAAPGAGFGSQNYGGGVRNEAGGKLNMTGGTITMCYSREGGGIMNVRKPDESGSYAGTQAPSVIVSGGEISGCMSQQKGAAIQTIYGGAETTVSGGAVITGNASLNDLGVLSVEEGGALTVSGGEVNAGSKNALYLYNKYSAEDYASAVTKPFIEGDSVGVLAVTGSPSITGKVHIDDSCVVYEKGTSFEACADLTGYAGSNPLTLDFTGGEKSFGPVAKWGSITPTYTKPDPDGGTYVFYREMTEGGTTTLSRSGYALTFTQTEPNKLEVSGTCDTAITAFTVAADTYTATLTLTDGVVSGTIDFTGATAATYTDTQLKPTLNGAEQTFNGSTLNVLLFDSTTKTITAPSDTAYLTEAGTYAPFSGTTLPAGAALDGGNATFKVGENIVTVHMGKPEDTPTFDGEVVTLADVTNASLMLDVITAYRGLAFRLSYESGGSTAYTAWQTPDASGRLSFDGLAAATEYTVLARTPAGTESLPSAAVPCPGGVFATLTGTQNTAKSAFETAYNTWETTPTADPADALEKYEALGGTFTGTTDVTQLALDEVTELERERLANLVAARDELAAQAWLDAYRPAMEDAVKNPAPAGTRDTVGASIGAYDELSEGAKALVDEALASASLPDPLTAYRSLTAAEIRSKAAETPGLEDFCETYANAVQGAAAKEDVDNALDNFQQAVVPAQNAQEKYNDFVAANDLTPRARTLAGQALEQTYDKIAAAAGDETAMYDAVNALDGALEHAKDAGEAFQDYLDSREALTGETLPVDAQTGLPTGTDDAAREAVDTAFALAEAANFTEMNALLQEKVNALLDEAGQNGSSVVQKLVEDGKAAVREAVDAANAGGALADLSSVVRETKSKIDAQKASEQAAANAAALSSYKDAAERQIEALAAQYDDTEMYEAAREELESLEASALEDVGSVTLSRGLAAARQTLDDIVAEAETAFARKAAQGQAQKEYLDGAESPTGAVPDPAASPAKEALAAIGQAQDTPAMNDALREALTSMAEGLVDRAEDSDRVCGVVDRAVKAMEDAALSAGDGEIAKLADALANVRSDIAAGREADIEDAKAEYLAAYNAITGEGVTDLSDPAVKAAADAIGAAQNCAEANAALAKAVDAVLEALRQPGDSAGVTKAIDNIRESVAAKIAESGGKIAEVAGLLGNVRAETEALRNAAQTPDDSEPTDPAPTSPEPTSPEPADTEPTDTEPANPEPIDSESNDSDSEPDSTEPAQPDSSGTDGSDEPDRPESPDASGGDSAERAAFEELKTQLLDEAEKLLREHDGELVREVFGRCIGVLENVEFEESAPDESLDSLRAAYEDVELETRQAQRLQRFENSAKAAIAKAKETGRYDGEALDGLLDTYTALAAELPAEGKDGDPQSDMDALYEAFTAELDALREPPASLWWLLTGLAALFAACVAAQLLIRRKNEKRDKTGR